MNKFLLLLFFISNLAHSQNISMIFSGDFMLGDKTLLTKNLLGDANEWLMGEHDIAVFNLESTVGNVNNLTPKCSPQGGSCWTFNMPEQTIAYLQQIKPQNSKWVFSQANNHALDYGMAGLKETQKLLERYEFHTIGTLSFPLVSFTVKNKKIIIIAASPHRNTIQTNHYLLDKIKELKKLNDIVVVMLHMGAEGENKYIVEDKDEIFMGHNRGNVYQYSRKLIDYGADAVVSSGPHTIRPIELYKDKVIAYSLGNFLTVGNFNLSGKNAYTFLLKLNFNTKDVKAEILPLIQTKSIYPQMWAKGMYLKKSNSTHAWLTYITKQQFLTSGLYFSEINGISLKNE